MRRHRFAWTIATALASGTALAQDPAGPVSAASLLQVLLGLAAVLAMVAGCAWLLRRMGAVPGAGSALVRVIGGASVGTRERIVLVEVSDTWLVVGVAPGQVRALAQLPRGELPQQPPAGPAGAFGDTLQRLMERSRAR